MVLIQSVNKQQTWRGWQALLLLLLQFSALQCVAETRYVTDQINARLRDGPGTSHTVVAGLPSGTPVELLQAKDQNGFYQVRSSDGTVGFIHGRLLMDKPSAQQQLEEAQAKLQQLSASSTGQLAVELEKTKQENQSLLNAQQQLQTKNQKLQQELEIIRRISEDDIRIANERNTLRKQVADLTRETAELKQRNLDLSNQTAHRWFLIGAGVIVLGIILGLLLPQLRLSRTKDSWRSL